MRVFYFPGSTKTARDRTGEAVRKKKRQGLREIKNGRRVLQGAGSRLEVSPYVSHQHPICSTRLPLVLLALIMPIHSRAGLRGFGQFSADQKLRARAICNRAGFLQCRLHDRFTRSLRRWCRRRRRLARLSRRRRRRHARLEGAWSRWHSRLECARRWRHSWLSRPRRG
jgi:hypothetical protein